MPNGISKRCQECDKTCRGIGKNMLMVEELAPIPARCFVDEVDLEPEDKRLITHPRRDGAYIALIDSLLREEKIALQETIGLVDPPHYTFNQTIWLDTAKYLFGKKNDRPPTNDEIMAIYEEHNPRYRLEYMFLFPEMIEINNTAKPERVTKLRKLLQKADEVAVENTDKYNYVGACHTFRNQMRRARIGNVDFTPSYTKVIFEKEY